MRLDRKLNSHPSNNHNHRRMAWLAGSGRTCGCHRAGTQITALTQQRQQVITVCPRRAPGNASLAIRRTHHAGKKRFTPRLPQELAAAKLNVRLARTSNSCTFMRLDSMRRINTMYVRLSSNGMSQKLLQISKSIKCLLKKRNRYSSTNLAFSSLTKITHPAKSAS